MSKEEVCTIYNNISDWFDSARNKSLVEKPQIDFVLSKLPNNSDVLDLGCGSGEPIAKYLIKYGCNITGVDGSKNMIDLCKKRFPKHSWLETDMRLLNLDKKFDAIFAWDSFFHLSCNDQCLMFPLFKSHLNTGGILIFSSGWQEGEFWNKMHGKEEVDMFHASLSIEEYKSLLNHYSFKILKHKIKDPDCGGRCYWIAQKY